MTLNALAATVVGLALSGTTSAATNTGATVVTGTRRVVRRGLGIFRR